MPPLLKQIEVKGDEGWSPRHMQDIKQGECFRLRDSDSDVWEVHTASADGYVLKDGIGTIQVTA